MARVVLAEDDDDFRALLTRTLVSGGHQVRAVPDGIRLIDALDFAALGPAWRPDFDVLITDFHMPGLTGVEVLDGLASVGAASRVIVISAFADPALAAHARRVGAAAVLPKPFEMRTLLATVLDVVHRAITVH